MSRPLVSVVIPAFNVEPYLAEALASVAAQDYAPIETIVVDDGSTDGTAAVAEAWDGVRLIRQGNRGVAAARNVGARVASGEFIALLDADDMWAPAKTRLQVEFLLANPDTGYVFCHFRHVHTHDGSFSNIFEEATGPAVIPSSMMVRRSVYERLSGYNEAMRTAEDLDFIVRAREAGIGADTLPEVLLTKRTRPGSLTADAATARALMVQSLRASLHRRRAADA